MSLAKDQSVDTNLQPPTSAVAVRTETDTRSSLEPSLASSSRKRNGTLPPPNGQPSVARAADLMTASATMPDVAARAQMSIAMQQTVGNARMGELLNTIPETKAPPPAMPQAAATPTQPATATVSPPTLAQEPAKTASATEPKTIALPAPPASSKPAEKPAAEAAAIPAPAPGVASTKAPTPTPSADAAQKPPEIGQKAETAAGANKEESTASEGAKGAGAAVSADSAKAGATAPAKGRAGKAESGKAGAAAVEVAGEEGGAPGKGKEGGGREVKLKMPEPPADVTPAARQRIRKVQSSAGRAATAQASLPSAQTATTQARDAVTEPAEETHACAEAKLVKELGERPKPSPQIEELCANIREVIRCKRPPNERSLVKAEPEAMAKEAGNEMKGKVEGGIKSVDQSYDKLDQKPSGTPQKVGQPLESPPVSAPVPAVNATQATPDAVPEKNVSLDADAEASQKQMKQAGMETEPAKLAKTGPVAEAREAQGELEQSAKEDPAKVLAAQQAALSQANAGMAELQQKALDALAASRRTTVTGTTGQQKKMVGSEVQTRATVSDEAQKIFAGAQTTVNGFLRELPQKAMKKWDERIAVATRQFKETLREVKEWIAERHSGVGGFFLSIGDRLSGLPARVTRTYDAAEKKFGDDVCNLAREISTEVNGVIMTCEGIIADARTRIATLFASLPKHLEEWAAGEQARLGAQLDSLHKRAHEVRDNFNREIVNRASHAVQEVREQIHELRQKAKGLIGRIADAIGRFLDDPVKFIIEALLDLLSIPAAAFWAVVAKIQKVIGDIADDPKKFANNLMAAVGKGFSQFFNNITDHLLHGFMDWLTGGLAAAGVSIPKDFSLKSIITFILELMGITWPRIRKLLAKHIGEENVALLEKAYSIVANLVALGPEGIFELIKEKLNPQEILDQIIKAAVDYMMSAVVKAVSARILMLFNPVGAILQALEAIYRVLKWIFTNAERIFRLIETIVNGIADIIAGNIGGMANAVEKALASLIAPVIDFLADYLGFGDLPEKVKETIISFQNWIEGILDQVIGWLVEKGKALLAAVGIGGKEDAKDKEKKAAGDEEVGRTVTFTAGGKDHKLWIAVGAGGAEVRVASDTPETVEQKLSRWESNLDDAGERKEEAKAAIATAKKLLSVTEKDAQEALAAKQEVKNKPENAEMGSEFQKKDDKTEADQETLSGSLKTLFEIFGETKTILVLLGVQLVKRGKNDADAKTDDVETEEAKKVPSFGYSLHTREKPEKRIHIQRHSNKKGSNYPDVHIDEKGLLQEGPSSPEGASDDDKIKVYDKLLGLVGLDPLNRKDYPTADKYRAETRDRITKKLIPITNELMAFMNASKEIPSEYNRLRGDIYDICVSSFYQYSRPGPLFLKSTHPSLTKEKRQPDGVLGSELYDAKGHTGIGPSAEEDEQYQDYLKIIGGRFIAEGNKGPFTIMNYIIMDLDANKKWKDAFKSTLVRVLP